MKQRLCWGLLVLFASATPVGAAPASTAAEFPDADFSGYSSGAVIHAGALQAATDGPRLVDTEVAFSGAAVASRGFKGAIHDELKQAVLPNAKVGAKAYGRASPLRRLRR